ncbi:MAG: 3-hydroxy-3-methylglutaryl-CoA synthase [Crenarchaeota archaeon]|nr:MAG: 3-hydroxy-3-methylglutaryl-CoA synthase [Thermoproteota archaeon]RDJ34135.1 MAG: 3-hydroxy-3-methylglutaryl-CoA synthase [Thermoproteota archaeon]RDJ36749.1 MAG: 3-hydroxy-3-methylglutaryl-CoA synthase [Thermoproteota archaeon]RDJ37717.1 MAG: 3-hydroxy-3-methylglutaryl-CoA synthase [Thermoproteota archaeon]
MAAGIDDIAIYIPRLYVDAADFARGRGLDPAKLQKGLGVSQMAIVDTNQDPACLAANACLRIMQRNKLSPEDIGRLYVSTESSFDESKAMNSYVIGMLEQVYGQGAFEHCGGVETKFACVSGSYALYDNTNWIRAGEAEGKHALVVVSDIAKYDLGSSGEMTQGAGSVAMLLNDTPRLLAFDPKVTSTSIKDEYDFYRPFGKETPIVHGQYSNLLYLIQVRKALEAYKKKAISTGIIKLRDDETILDHIDFLNMHLPYANMGKKALAYLVRHEWRTLPRWKKIIEKIGMSEPIPKDPRGTIESVLGDQEFMEKDHEFTKMFTKTEEYQEVYESKLASSLIASTMIGNLYTASLYLGFRSSLEFEYQKGTPLSGKRVGFGSYGSGSSAMVFSGVIQEEFEEIVKDMNLESEIGPRKKLTIEEYEALHENKLGVADSMLQPKKEFVLTEVNSSVGSGERRYIFNE